MSINVGDKIPSVNLFHMTEDGPAQISTDDIFGGKKVAFFVVPGAFTPTCSAAHLPGFVDNADALKAKGVDSIVCVSVNDPFVMAAWGKAQNVGDKVALYADPGDLVKAVGMELDLGVAGLGVRSNRYSMVVDNGTVAVLNDEGGPDFEVSSAEAL
ncbi:MAG: peroxiredoxin, partial [Alphaproteobacteria bacterium]|nr:peroxiredoxin [Alphaproteobacteria bacterium]